MNCLASIVLSAILLSLPSFGLGEENSPKRKCLDTTRHKSSPSEEKELNAVCSHWEGKVCCTKHTSDRINKNLTDFYHMSHYLCKNSALSKPCMEFFQKDACLFECSPDLWQYGNVKDFNGDERVKSVPLCESDCNAWFNACAKDMTYSSNWSVHHRDSRSSNDSGSNKCETFAKKFGTAENFCQSIWDNAYQVVKDSAHCMSLQGNVNEVPETSNSSLKPNENDQNSDAEAHPSHEENNKTDKHGSNSSPINKNYWYIFTAFFGLFYCSF